VRVQRGSCGAGAVQARVPRACADVLLRPPRFRLAFAAEGRLDVALQTLERATRYLAAAQREQEEAVRAEAQRRRRSEGR